MSKGCGPRFLMEFYHVEKSQVSVRCNGSFLDCEGSILSVDSTSQVQAGVTKHAYTAWAVRCIVGILGKARGSSWAGGILGEGQSRVGLP